MAQRERQAAPGMGRPARNLDGKDEAITSAPIDEELSTRGFAVLPELLAPRQCTETIDLYAADRHFRSRIVMAQHGFGRGEYKYFSYPLPAPIAQLRETLYPALAPIANRWQEQLRSDLRYPLSLQEFLQRCHAAGQTRPTPLLLRYEAGDFNCLHQDVYGALLFPLQVAILLSRPGDDFTGGEFVLTEQRPRQQSRATVVPLMQGDAVVFPVRERPVGGTRGMYRAQLRHGVSRLLQGNRYTLGLIFHDAA
ncbi:MAG TPA: 2OG-Fe(II) oxygenase [Dongiaceae bacterium]|nr:2OG-Fe(II) oxygenase [Dongiaceae bacterium]